MRLFSYAYLFVFFALVGTCFAQDDEYTVHDRRIGIHLNPYYALRAREFEFAHPIVNTYFDTTSNSLTVQLRHATKNGKNFKMVGNILYIDLQNYEIRWAKPVDYSHTMFQQIDSLIIETRGDEGYALDLWNGKPTWENTFNVYAVDPVSHQGMGYGLFGPKKIGNLLRGIDLSTGLGTWRRKVDREYGWDDVFLLNANTWVIVSSGLHTLNPATGEGWDYVASTGKKDPTGMILSIIGSVASAALIGTYYLPVAGPDIIYGMASNVIYDDTRLYFASREKLACIDITSGNVNWSKDISKETGSKAIIFDRDDILYVLNLGYAFNQGRMVNAGKPFLAAYNIHDGTPVYFQLLKNNAPIISSRVVDGTLYALSAGSVQKLSLTNGVIIKEQSLGGSGTDDLSFFTDLNSYILKDSALLTLEVAYPGKLFVSTEHGRVLILDHELSQKGEIESNLLYKSFISGNYTFLHRDKQMIILDKYGMKVAEVEASRTAMLIGTKLYDVKEKSIVEMDLSGVIGK
jgi:outer membrane protein assembly factor BamB